MASPFEKKRIPGIQREAPPMEAPPMEALEVEPAVEVEEEASSELLRPEKVLYTTERCSSCEYFLGDACAKVSGSISADGWCILHELKVPEVPEVPEEALV